MPNIQPEIKAMITFTDRSDAIQELARPLSWTTAHEFWMYHMPDDSYVVLDEYDDYKPEDYGGVFIMSTNSLITGWNYPMIDAHDDT